MTAVQSLILGTSFHTMRALDENKEPLREWVGGIERYKESGGKDFGPVKKE